MSRPPFLTLPDQTRAYRLQTARGAFAVLDTTPPAGTATRGTALLIPGFTGSKEDFIALLEPLAAAGFRTVAVDGRGQHETGGPRDEAVYAQAELAADVIAQAHAVRDAGPVHLLGHSMGGLVVRRALLDGGADGWASLTVMSSGPAAIEAEQQSRTQLLIDALAGGLDMETVWQAMRAMDVEDAGAPAPEASTDAVDEFMHRRWLGNVPEQLVVTGRQLVSEPDRVAELAAVPLPKLVISGAVDHAWPPAWLDDMAKRLDASRAVIEGAEHSPNTERPEATAQALSAFWGQC
ncbi:alpha/beta hydrolase [Streptomyces sp. NBC_01537]|uniref:alpha/beta fold hydrolase n=1 Tax=Streptomyces sp. NBC_01537 TaxID=2903896 RepID=UPI0038686E26